MLLLQERFNEMKKSEGTYYVTVLEDTRTNAVIGCASLVVEQKFIHNAATVRLYVGCSYFKRPRLIENH